MGFVARATPSIGETTRHWGDPGDEFNEAAIDAREKGWIDREGRLTEAGVLYLNGGEVDSKSIAVVTGGQKEPGDEGFRFPLAVHNRGRRDQRAVPDVGLPEKKLQDEVHAILLKRGFQVEDVEVYVLPDLGSDGEAQFGLTLHFNRTDRGGSGKKTKQNLRVAEGTSDVILTALENLSTRSIPTTQVSKKISRANKRN